MTTEVAPPVVSEHQQASPDEEAEHKLEHRWTFWEHRADDKSSTENYGSNMASIGTFDTAEGFWRFYNHMPPPSETFFTLETGKKKFADRSVNGFALFKEGIRPEWEDEANSMGGEIYVRPRLNALALDQHWEDLLLGIVGETIDPSDVITGCRVVDKTKDKMNMYAIEVWYKCPPDESETIEEIKNNVIDRLNASFNFLEKSHADEISGGGHHHHHRGGGGGGARGGGSGRRGGGGGGGGRY